MELLELIKNALEDKKGNDITVIDFKNENPLCDYFVVCDAQSNTQINALADAVEKAVRDAGYPLKEQETHKGSDWVLIDAIDVVVHIFNTETRQHYNLEKLYQDYLDNAVL